MKLRRFNADNVRVGTTGGGGRGFPGGGGGKLGLGTLVIVIIAALVFGADPGQMLGQLEQGQTGSTIEQRQMGGESAEQLCNSNAYALETCNALSSLNETWQPLFGQAGVNFRQPMLRFATSSDFQSGCGRASTGMGPFYCPADEGIYIDTGFYDTMERQLRAGGDFARYYVVAHEYGHHIQNLTGVADAIRSAQAQNPQAANQLQVRMELQADCYAGVWAGRNRNLIEPGDFEEGMTAASAIGDDSLQRNTGQSVSPESFTHGTSAQRMQALRAGMETGDETRCDAYMQFD